MLNYFLFSNLLLFTRSCYWLLFWTFIDASAHKNNARIILVYIVIFFYSYLVAILFLVRTYLKKLN